MFQHFKSHDQHNRQERDNWCPLLINLITGNLPPIRNNSIKSWNYPCISPQIVSGALTATMLDSSIKISFAWSIVQK
jgi:hypothetical protein